MAFAVTFRAQKTFIDTDVNPTTSSFTPADNSLLVCVMHHLTANSSPFAVRRSVSDSLSGTWTSEVVHNRDVSFGTNIEIWTRPVTTGASMTVTTSEVSGEVHVDGTAAEFNIFEITGHDTVGNWRGLENNAENNSTTAYTLSLGGTASSTSLILGAATLDGDYGAASVSAGTGCSSIYSHNIGTSGWERTISEYIEGAVTGIEFGDSNITYIHSYAAIEIKASGSTSFIAKNKLTLQAVKRASYY